MKFDKKFNKLCAPAKLYLILSILVTVGVSIQNLLNGTPNQFCIGSAKCTTTHVLLLFVLNILYILFWTWLLNWFCSKKLEGLSWFIVLIPFLLAAILLGTFIVLTLKDELDSKNNQPPVHTFLIESNPHN